MEKLTPREKTILILRQQGKSLTEIGKLFNISRERVRQIEFVAKNKLALKGRNQNNLTK
jgi:RNA polymerase sigma factor (sigma-70 family)